MKRPLPEGIEEVYILPDGTEVDELPPDQMKAFKQKVLDLFTPLLYEYEMKKLAEESQ